MKKLLSLSMTLILLTLFVFPFQAFAQEDKELEAAISKAKSVLNIKDGYDTFNYNLYKRDNVTVFDLSWNDSKNKLRNINVSIESNGRIVNYYSYKPYTGDISRTKLPAVNKDKGLTIANEFILKVDPSLKGKLKYIENNGPIDINDSSYHYSFIRIENGVPFPGNTVEVGVDNATGDVQNFYSNWQDDLVFPAAKNVISMETAQKYFIDKLGLKLAYKLSYDYDKKTSSPYLIYTNVYGSQSIDATTGEIINTGGIYYGATAQKTEAAAGRMNMDQSSNSVILTPEEKNAVESASNLISQSKAEEIGRKTLELSSDFKVDSINLYNNGMEKGNFTWSIYFTKKQNDDSYYESASISLDAKSGEVMNFYKSVPYDSNKKVQYSKEQTLAIAKDFIKSMQSSKYNDVEYTTWGEPIVRPMDSTEKPRQYYFTFTRKANGAYFIDNGFNITVDSIDGSVINYNYTWYKDKLPKTDNIISLEKAHKLLFDSIGLELQYTADYTSQMELALSSKIMPPRNDSDVKPQIKLIYTIKPGKPSNIDASTGKLLDYSGKPYIERTIAEYSDIKGNAAENQIKILSQYGISLPGSEFKPNDVIKEKEFLYLLLKSTNFYMDIDMSDDTKSEEALYNYLSSMGIVKDGEKSPSSSVTKENAVKFVIRALKYDKVGELKGIYSLSFKDSKSITSNLYGYVALAYGLNIVKDDGGYFKPAEKLTKAQAAVIIYNLLGLEQ